MSNTHYLMVNILFESDNVKKQFAYCKRNTRKSNHSGISSIHTMIQITLSHMFRLSELESMRDRFDSLIYNRALHCVTEDIRTLSAVDALKRNDFATVGLLMTESHRSLQHHYEVCLLNF